MIKLNGLLLIKINLALFWIMVINILFFAAINSSRGIKYHLMYDLMFQYFLFIGVLGLLSIFLEKFFKNLIIKYFLLSIFLTSCYFFIFITMQFIGIMPSSLKGVSLEFNELLLHYCINIIFFCLAIFGIYNLLTNKTRFLYICHLGSLLHLFIYALFYGMVKWNG